jgi:hypothetical protein
VLFSGAIVPVHLMAGAGAALERGDLDGALRLSDALYWFGVWRADSEVLSWAAEVVERSAGSHHPALPRVHAAAGVGAWLRGDLAGADDLGDRGLALIDDRSIRRTQLLECRGDVALFRGDLAAADAAYVDGLALAREAGDDYETTILLTSVALSGPTAVTSRGRSRTWDQASWASRTYPTPSRPPPPRCS